MGNENERKHSPAENRQEWLGHGFDETKSGGGGETNVGQTGASAGGGGMSTGSGGIIGGSADFLTDTETNTAAEAHASGQQQTDPQSSSGNQQNLTGQQGGDATFGGSGSGSSFLASNTGQSDLGSAGIGERSSGDDGDGASSGSQTEGSSGYLQQDVQNPELSREDALDQEEDDGMGLSSGQGQA